jgi:LmbE family N-acetylglucosaminyl deacetylase
VHADNRSMTRILTFPAHARLLVFAPHPDDETLATGELIQSALAAGARVRVVFATDGDNNPWPQRWFERRWHIGAAERARWGERRRAEARIALDALGVGADSARFLGWPDLGLTDQLERDDSAIDTLADEIARYVPTHVAMPSLRDRHPDHAALRVMLELALEKARVPCVQLGYVVHGRAADSGDWLLARDAGRHQRKRDALLAHESQISLSRDRLLRWADQPESFEQAEPAAAVGASDGMLRIALQPRRRFLRRHDVLLIVTDGTRIERARIPLPRLVGAGANRTLGQNLCGGRVSIELIDGTLRVTFDGDNARTLRGYLKLERTAPRVLIFDVETWHRFEDLAAVEQTTAPHAEPVAITQRASL